MGNADSLSGLADSLSRTEEPILAISVSGSVITIVDMAIGALGLVVAIIGLVYTIRSVRAKRKQRRADGAEPSPQPTSIPQPASTEPPPPQRVEVVVSANAAEQTPTPTVAGADEVHASAFRVPYPRNPYFTGRDDILEQLHGELTAGGAAAISQAITGLGGVGKTQTAVEYAYRRADDYSYVFWVRAETEGDVVSGLAEVARRLKLREAAEPDQNAAAEAAINWLEENGEWLLVYDNMDDPDAVRKYVPLRPKGHILVTSRAHSLDVLGVSDPVALDVLPEDEAVDFLFDRTGRDRTDPAETSAAKDLARELGCLPLALEQAAAFVKKNASTFVRYLKAYRAQPLPTLDGHDPVMGEYREPVSRTWAMNFEAVAQESEAAADLLRASAFLAPDDIPLELIETGASSLGPVLVEALANVGSIPTTLDRLLGLPSSYSLITRDVEAQTYSIHRLVQEVLKADMGEDEQREWAERAVSAANAVFPKVEFENWPLCDRLLPHARAAADSIAEWEFVFEEAGRLLNQMAGYLRERAQLAEAVTLCERTLENAEMTLGADHQEVATSLNNLENRQPKGSWVRIPPPPPQ